MGGAQAGLQEGDEILLVDGRDVRAMSPREVHDALEGEVGTSVRLTVFRRGRIQRLVVTRTALEKGP
jgi:C-terminal processing protease CtpA/Prc